MEAVQKHICNYDTSIARASNRVAGKRGKKIANVAAARQPSVCSYSVLKNKETYY